MTSDPTADFIIHSVFLVILAWVIGATIHSACLSDRRQRALELQQDHIRDLELENLDLRQNEGDLIWAQQDLSAERARREEAEHRLDERFDFIYSAVIRKADDENRSGGSAAMVA